MIIKKRNKPKKDTINQETSSLIGNKINEENVDLFDLDNIEFSPRQERRRGNRRRGYRRIDDRNLISRAQEEAGSIKDRAAEEGYKTGLEKAQQDIEQLKDNLKVFHNTKQEIFEYIAPDILEISIDIAKKIVKKEIEQDPQLVLNTVLSVLKNISKEEAKIVIKVSPSQIESVKENIFDIVSSLGLEIRTNIISDDTIEEGGCIVQTSNGIVDATINTQLEIIKEAFKGM